MYLQGSLQTVFDALYHLGIITPILEMDWTDAMQKWPSHQMDYAQIVEVANAYQQDMDLLMKKLEHFDDMALGYLAMEVAREFADYHAREAIH